MNIKRFTSPIMTAWNYCVGPVNPNSERFNVRTRFKLALLSFALLSIVFGVSFAEAVKSEDNERTETLLSFAQHISYVLGAVVASYVGMESVFPSIGGYGWRGRGTKAEPPVGPGSDDSVA